MQHKYYASARCNGYHTCLTSGKSWVRARQIKVRKHLVRKDLLVNTMHRKVKKSKLKQKLQPCWWFVTGHSCIHSFFRCMPTQRLNYWFVGSNQIFIISVLACSIAFYGLNKPYKTSVCVKTIPLLSMWKFYFVVIKIIIP